MNQRQIRSCACILILIVVVAVPVLAATVTCPSSCSCLLPAEAKKIAAPGYCQGKQAVCGYDMQKNEKYCYEKPVTPTTKPQLIITAKPYVTMIKPTVTTTVLGTNPISSPCPSGCTCLKSGDGKAKGLAYCGGKQVTCGYDTNKTPLSCFSQSTSATGTVATGVLATTPVSLSVPAGSPSAATAVITRANAAITGTTGIPPSGPVTHEVTAAPAVLQVTTAPVAPAGMEPGGGGIVSAILNFFSSLLGGTRGSPEMAARPCGPLQVPCNGVCTSILSNDDNCGGCGNRCPILQDCCAGHCTDRYADASNCGECGVTCALGHACCSGRCTDIAADWFNCGSCGRSCDHINGCCNGICRDIITDESNCGECGNTCDTGETCCWPGRCQEEACEYHPSGGSETDGAGRNAGTPGMVAAGVVGSVVVVGAASDSGDPGGGTEFCITSETCHQFMTCCSNRCWDLNLSSSHCGACGNACPNNQSVCLGGICNSRGPLQP